MLHTATSQHIPSHLWAGAALVLAELLWASMRYNMITTWYHDAANLHRCAPKQSPNSAHAWQVTLLTFALAFASSSSDSPGLDWEQHWSRAAINAIIQSSNQSYLITLSVDILSCRNSTLSILSKPKVHDQLKCSHATVLLVRLANAQQEMQLMTLEG